MLARLDATAILPAMKRWFDNFLDAPIPVGLAALGAITIVGLVLREWVEALGL